MFATPRRSMAGGEGRLLEGVGLLFAPEKEVPIKAPGGGSLPTLAQFPPLYRFSVGSLPLSPAPPDPSRMIPITESTFSVLTLPSCMSMAPSPACASHAPTAPTPAFPKRRTDGALPGVPKRRINGFLQGDIRSLANGRFFDSNQLPTSRPKSSRCGTQTQNGHRSVCTEGRP